jgi:hypothetical protein
MYNDMGNVDHLSTNGWSKVGQSNLGMLVGET